MIVNGKTLLKRAPIVSMEASKMKFEGTSYGLSEAGYDIRIAQTIEFIKSPYGDRVTVTHPHTGESETQFGSFCLASSMEAFNTPNDLVGTVKDKSTWARKGLSVFNTVIEPGWRGECLTLELVYHGNTDMTIQAGCGIAQVLYMLLAEEGDYGQGKYQDAHSKPQPALG